MSTEALLRQAVRGALAVGAAGSMVGAGVALAQTAPAAGTAGGTTKLSNIVVTGSHIPQTAIATAQPIITINRSQIEATGFTTVGQLLQNMTQSGQALNEQFNNGGNGSEEINLHQLGSQRVLVLVNGQRWLPTLGNTVDLTTIPTAIVQRVEILLDGASAIYGSEAMAGVINVITTKNFNGARADAYVGAYDGHGDGGGWDGKTQQYSFTVGTSSDRSSVLLSAGYYQQQPVWAGQRNISRYPIVGFGAITGSSGTPGGRFLTLGAGPLGMPTFPGASSACVSFSSTIYDSFCDIAGPINGSNANAHAWSNADRYNYAPANYLRTPEQQWYTYVQGHYDLTDNVSFHFTTQYLRRNSDQVLAPNPWFFGLFGGLYANGLPVGISATNPYNPFHVDMVPAYLSSTSLVNSWCSLYGTGGGGTCTSSTQSLLLLGRRPLEAGNRIFNQNKSTFYFNGGFNGYFTLADNQWQWNVDYVYGDTLQTTITSGLANTLRIQEALGPNCPLAGANPSTPACVPLNMFGGDINGQGTITKGMLNWVMFTAHDVTENIMRDYNANLSGSFWNSWYAGPWGAAVGYEYLEHDGFFSPDPTIASGNTVGNVGTKTGGRENTNAEYFEINIPLASGLPFAKMINLDLANRWSQFRWSGISNFIDNSTTPPSIQTGPAVGTSHASTARATLTWRPIDQLLLRGTWSAGFRIPSISELFSGAGTNYPSLTDPCANAGAPGAPPLAPSALGCTGAAQPNTQILATAGGFANLQPEKSISRSVGFVYSPEWVPGLDINADYFKVEVDHIIGTLGGQFYLNACYLGGITQYCNNIVRAGGIYSTGAVTNIYNLVTNSGSFKVNGWDFGIKYRFPTTAIGDFTVALNGTFYKSAVGCSIPTRLNPLTLLPQSNCADGAGSLGTPKHLYNASLDWNYGPWAATWRMQIIGPMYEYCSNSGLHNPNLYNIPYNTTGLTFWNGKPIPNWCQNPSASSPAYFGTNTGLNRLGTTVYNDVQASYTLSSWNTTFTLGANNLLNKQPPVSYTTFANSYLPNYYRTPGRFFYGRVSVSF